MMYGMYICIVCNVCKGMSLVLLVCDVHHVCSIAFTACIVSNVK